MKKFTYLMAIVVLFTAIVSASAGENQKASNLLQGETLSSEGLTITDSPDFKNNKVNVVPTFTMIDTVDHASRWMFANSTTFVFDPIDNSLYYTRPIFKYVNGTSDAVNTIVGYSKNLGESWNKEQVTDLGSQNSVFFQSICVGNPESKQSLSDIPYIITGRYYNSDGFKGKILFYNTPDGIDGDFLSNPEDNNDDDYSWNTPGNSLKYINVYDEGDAIAFGVSLLSPEMGSNSIWSDYGLLGWHFNANEQFLSTVPKSIKAHYFQQSPDGHFMGQAEIDTDNDNNIYIGINAALDGNNGQRNIAVIKSEEMGRNFSDMNIVPNAVYQEYFDAEKIDDEESFGSIGHYDKESFIVYGNDKYSYFTQFGFWTSTLNRIHLVEVYYNQGTWGIRKIDDQMIRRIDDQIVATPYYIFAAPDQGTGRNEFAVESNPLGNEIQAAKTIDGEHIIIKYIKITHDTTFATPVNIYDPEYNATTQDWEYILTPTSTFFSTDIFVATRALADSDWNLPENLTDDIRTTNGGHKVNQHGSKIPSLVPSIDKIPIIYDQQWIYNFDHIPPYVQASSGSFMGSLQFALYDARLEIGVEREENYSFNLSNATPNPASEYCNIPYTMEEAGFITLELYDALGQKVADLDKGMKYAGPQSVRVNLSGLPSGAYYYTMTVDGQRLTRSLSVIK